MRAAGVLAVALLWSCQTGDRAPKQAPAPEAATPLRTPGPDPMPVPPPTAPLPGTTAATAAYVRDVDRICNVETYAQADQPGVNPALLTAQWLGANLETDAARDLLVRFNREPDAGKAAFLDAETARLGIGACPTARKWDGVR